MDAGTKDTFYENQEGRTDKEYISDKTVRKFTLHNKT